MTKQKYLDLFIKEAEEHLAALQKGLLDLEKDAGNTALIHDLLRNAHTVKGSAMMVGFEEIGLVAHRMEDLLKDVEDGRFADAQVINLLLKGNDAITRMISSLAGGVQSPVDVNKIISAFDGEEVVEEIAAAVPQEESLSDTVRTKVKTLDGLVNLIGELILMRNRLDDRLTTAKELALAGEKLPIAAALRKSSRDLEEDVMYLHQLIQELQVKTLELRMLPLSTITEGFRRMVRDLSREQGKEAELVVSGDTIELDRVLLENLKPMFLHMLRNSIDHGIEPPQERLEKGKPAHGTITISARYEGNSVRIDIRDDGKGLDPHRIKNAAVQKGLIDKDEAELLKDEEAIYLIFKAGFSTSDFVTDVSGRGIGMDVVKRNVEQVKGNLLLRSDVGSFTEVTLNLPLTLSVIEALLIVCGEEHFAIPLNYVQETIKVRREEIATVGGKEVVSIRGVTVPLVSLASLLGLTEKKSFLQSEKLTAVVFRFREQLIACSVDKSIGSLEIVVKGLGSQLKSVGFVSGATILSDGNPALILNVPDLFARSEEAAASGIRQAMEQSQVRRVRGTILVVDDSITTRTMERSILMTRGYAVEIAISGEDALEKVSGRAPFDLVISDVEMPGINGFELTRRLRGIDAYRNVPIMIVSSLSRDEDKRQAMEAGAQAYIVKGTFEQGALLGTVEALIG